VIVYESSANNHVPDIPYDNDSFIHRISNAAWGLFSKWRSLYGICNNSILFIGNFDLLSRSGT
jgi:hypothetical protein